MSPRGRPRTFDRDAALDEAMYVFWERGYEGTSLSDLTAAMKIGSPSLYAAFGGKEALFREAIERYGERFGQRPPEGETARDAVEAWLRESARGYVEAGHPRGCMVVLAALNCTEQNRPVREFLAAKRRNNLIGVAARLRRAVAEGDLPEDADVEGIVRFYGTILHGMSIQARDGAELADLEAVIDTAMTVWPRFLGKKTAPG
ncbi:MULTISPECIES: TetR/AcrR family transcriptional regulator [Amycolatopsis]|uniref:TetR/AcrR family transcriptional regulator n=1 Tax=Amycolatopsis tucumanensis TaxID=401106 RepID=A0ABP7I679_9PSEU|nr:MULTISPECIES: TetR/AcrR family transcriptional regulator [Amycolatopsis]MCF6428732.1 TetR/AcrR family transcriptional regulator [Amycolatopsis tucumanensis]